MRRDAFGTDEAVEVGFWVVEVEEDCGRMEERARWDVGYVRARERTVYVLVSLRIGARKRSRRQTDGKTNAFVGTRYHCYSWCGN